jgi:hypothetical protein
VIADEMAIAERVIAERAIAERVIADERAKKIYTVVAFLCIMGVSCLRAVHMADGTIPTELVEGKWSYTVLFEKFGSAIFGAIVDLYAIDQFSRKAKRDTEFMRRGSIDLITKVLLQFPIGSKCVHYILVQTICEIQVSWLLLAFGILMTALFAFKKVSFVWYTSCITILLGLYDASVSYDLFQMGKEDINLKDQFSYIQNVANILCVFAACGQVFHESYTTDNKKSNVCDWKILLFMVLSNMAVAVATIGVLLLKGVRTEQFNWRNDYNALIPMFAYMVGYPLWFGIPDNKKFSWSGILKKDDATKELYAKVIGCAYALIFGLLCLDMTFGQIGFNGYLMALCATGLMAVDFLLDQLMKTGGLSNAAISLQKLAISTMLPIGKIMFDINSRIVKDMIGKDGDSLLNEFNIVLLGATFLSGCSIYALMNHWEQKKKLA